jgi:hypothetical protein
MTSSTTDPAEESFLANERRDNRIVAFVMGAIVFVSLWLLSAH